MPHLKILNVFGLLMHVCRNRIVDYLLSFIKDKQTNKNTIELEDYVLQVCIL